MGFSGNVSSMALDEVLEFLSSNALTGELIVQSGDEVSLKLYFQDGRMFFPFSARRGTYHLGRILRHTGYLSREALELHLDERKAKHNELADQEDSEEVRAARRMQYEEEIHDLFLWGDARFEFTPGTWSARVEADLEAGRGLRIDVTSLLMEVARRTDERRRIRQVIPSSRLLLSTAEAEGADAAVVAGLAAAKIECDSSPFDGTLDLDDMLERWGIPHHEALDAVAGLVLEGHLVPVPVEVTRDRIRELLGGEDLAPAARLLGHWAELDARGGADRFELGLEQEFITCSAFVSGPEERCNLRLEGCRIFTLLRVLIQLGNPFTLVLHHRGWEKRVAFLPGELYLKNERRKEAPTPPLRDYLVKLGHLKKEQARELAAAELAQADPEGKSAEGESDAPTATSLADLVEAEHLNAAKVARLIDELAEVAFWGRTEVELRNRASKGPEDEARSLTVGIGPNERRSVRKGLEAWAEVFDEVSGEDCIYLPGPKISGSDPAARFFKKFDMTRNVGELRRKAQATPLEFAQFVHRGLSRGYLRSPTADELEAASQEADAAGNDVTSYRIALAAAAHGVKGFEAGARGRATGLPLPFPALEGDLDGVGLAAVLQALRSQRRTGTLIVKADRREEKLYFQRGDASILRIDDDEADEFVAFFLGEDGADSMGELGSGLRDRGLTDESELSEAEAQELKDAFLDVLFWEDSTFGFFQNTLPDEFFNPGDNVTRIVLHTDRFLMEAIQSMTEWEALCEVHGGNRSIFEFTSAEQKLTAIRDRGLPQILTLIDGRLCLNDLVRISGQRRLDVGRVLASLVEDGALRLAGHKRTTRLRSRLEGDIPDAIPD